MLRPGEVYVYTQDGRIVAIPAAQALFVLYGIRS